MTKPLLIGMNNPQGNEALVATPIGGTGHRIWKMLTIRHPCMTEKTYENSFERMNILEARVWNTRQARAFAEPVRARMEGRTVVLLGSGAMLALGLPRAPWMVWSAADTSGGRWCVIPHPSGLNRLYNDVAMVDRVSELLSNLYSSGLGKVG